jgi:hypothetical protein
MVNTLVVRRRIAWPKTYRIIRSIFPPVDLFEDIADPGDWEALAAVEAKTNPRVRDQIGDLAKVPTARRVAGPGASCVMAPFVHCSTTRPGRFTDGSFGIYSTGDSEEVAIAETIHHHQRFMAATGQAPGWTSDFRVLVGSIDHDLDDVNAVPGVLDPNDYSASQKLGRDLRNSGSDGIFYDSVRRPGGLCIGVFWPDVIPIPIQGRHYCYHWNGNRVDYVKQYDTGTVFAVL